MHKMPASEQRKAIESETGLQDIQVWQERITKSGKRYLYWRASWHEGKKVRNIYLCSCEKKGHEEALKEVNQRKANSLASFDDTSIKYMI